MAQSLDVWLWAPTSTAYTPCLPHGLDPQSLGHFCQDHKEEALRPLQTLSGSQYPPPPLMCKTLVSSLILSFHTLLSLCSHSSTRWNACLPFFT